MRLIRHTAYMSLGQGAAAASSTVRLALAAVGDETGIMAAVELGNRARATLGHMPYAGYRDAAASGTPSIRGSWRSAARTTGWATCGSGWASPRFRSAPAGARPAMS